ncbi:hypothetical protein BDZ89DRAFT_1141639 [Hymenopellis radicata]|nr:hypothetical protein BDZ89DRAFT_1141639 [Hymenopellis radicata]
MAQVGEKEFTKLLGQSYGYGIVVGIGFAFAILMVGLTWVQAKFTQMNPNAASEFATASRSIKAGLICCGITSAWTWSATLLQSSTATYQSGVSASWWYGVGGTIQSPSLPAKVKMNANGATTFLQIVKARFGVPCHLLFTFYAFVCVHVVCGSLVLGASATSLQEDFELRSSVIVIIHTVILFVIIYIFVFTAYGTSDVLGSPGKMWDLLQEAAITHPVTGKERSLRDRKAPPRPICLELFRGCHSIPWGFGTVMGLGARALSTNPEFPTYPYALSAAQQSAGLVAPAAAVTMLGKGGAVAILIVTFMAATSAASAELIAVASIIVYDLLGTYWKPLTGRQVIFYSHIIIGLWAIWMGVWATILHKVGIDLGWLFYIQGVALTPAVVPIGLTVCWKRLSKHAALWGTLFGTVCGMLGWMVGCWKIYGSINVTNLALPYSAISGATPGLIMSTIATFLLAWIFPDNYDWQGTRAISNAGIPDSEASSIDEKDNENEKEIEKDTVEVVTENAALDRTELQRVFKKAAWVSLLLAFIITILIPMPMFGESYVFSRKFFTGWVAVSIIWLLMAGSFCILLPIWESRTEIYLIISE